MSAAWNGAELSAIAAAGEIELAPARSGRTLDRPTTVWVVRVGDDLYIRSYRGPTGSWFRAAVRTQRGRVRAGSLEREVTFEEAPDADPNAVEAAYRTKYGHSSYVEGMTTAKAAGTTLRLVPR